MGAEAFGRDNVGGGAAGFDHGRENFFPDGGCDFSGFHEFDEFGERLRTDRACVDFLAGIVQAAKKFGLHPVGRGFAKSASFHDSLEIVGQRLGCRENSGIVRRDAVGGDKAGAPGFG